jgi:hypothetical protein
MADCATGLRGNPVAWSPGPDDPVEDDLLSSVIHCVSAREVISRTLSA